MKNKLAKILMAIGFIALSNQCHACMFFEDDFKYESKKEFSLTITENSKTPEHQIDKVDVSKTKWDATDSSTYLKLNYKNKPSVFLWEPHFSIFIYTTNSGHSFEIRHTYQSSSPFYKLGLNMDNFEPVYSFDENLKDQLNHALITSDIPYEHFNTKFRHRADRPGRGWFKRNWFRGRKEINRIDTYSTKFEQGINNDLRCEFYNDFAEKMGFPSEVNRHVRLEMKCPEVNNRS